MNDGDRNNGRAFVMPFAALIFVIELKCLAPHPPDTVQSDHLGEPHWCALL